MHSVLLARAMCPQAMTASSGQTVTGANRRKIGIFDCNSRTPSALFRQFLCAERRTTLTCEHAWLKFVVCKRSHMVAQSRVQQRSKLESRSAMVLTADDIAGITHIVAMTMASMPVQHQAAALPTPEIQITQHERFSERIFTDCRCASASDVEEIVNVVRLSSATEDRRAIVMCLFHRLPCRPK